MKTLNENLTTKEEKVLRSVVDNTFEFGLPVSVDEIKEDTKLSKKSIVGIISSLYKKGYVIDYHLSEEDEFMLSEEAYNHYYQ